MSLRSFLRCSLLVLVALFPAVAANAQDAATADDDLIRLEGDHAAGYVHRAGGLLPIRLELSNTGTRDYVVRLEAEWDGLQGRALRRVDLPAGSFKEIDWVLGPVAHVGDYEVRAVDDTTDELLEDLFFTSISVAADRPLIGLLDGHPMGWGRLQEREEFNGKIVHLDPKLLPTQGEALGAFDILVWPDPRPGTLRDAQADMLAHWTQLGGILVLAGDRAGSGDLARWTTLRPGPVREIKHLGDPSKALTQALAATPILLPDGVGAERGEVFLAMEERGRGLVYLLGFDPRSPVLAGNPELTRFWSDLLKENLRPLVDAQRSQYEAWNLTVKARNYLTRGIGGLPLPLSTLGILLGLYLLVIGPGEYFLLRRLDRLKWTWWTFPTWVLLFTGLAWAVAVASRTGEPILRQIVLRDAPAGSDTFCEEIHQALFVLHSGEYRLNAPNSLPSVRSTDPEQFFGWGRNSRTSSTDWHFDRAAVSGRLPKWSFLTGGFLRHSPRQGARVEIADGRLTTYLGQDLRDAYLLAATPDENLAVITKLRHLQDGTPVSLGKSRFLIEDPEEFDFSEDFTAPVDPSSRNHAEGRDTERRDDLEEFLHDLIYLSARDLLARQAEGVNNFSLYRFYQTSYLSDDWSSYLRRGGKILLGWAPDPEPRVEVEGLDRSVKTSGIVVYRIAVEEDIQ